MATKRHHTARRDPRPHLIADGVARQGKAIWVITGDNVEVENIEFSGTKVASHNGAGIRAEGNRLLIRKCYFHDNEMGLMSNHNPRGEIVIEDSEFAHNTTDYEQHHRLGHNIYIGRIKRFTLRNSYIHDARVGHNVKTRAAENRLYYNLVADGGLRSSYLVDIAEGGQAYLVGNLFRQGPEADNLTLISYAAEGGRDRTDQSLYLVNNTLVNDATTGTFIRNHGVAHTHLRNNLFVGPGRHFTGLASSQGDVASDAPGFVDRPGLDFHLHADSPAIDQGRDPGSSPLGIDLYPRLEYSYPTAATPRRQVGAIDAGAFEYLPRL